MAVVAELMVVFEPRGNRKPIPTLRLPAGMSSHEVAEAVFRHVERIALCSAWLQQSDPVTGDGWVEVILTSGAPARFTFHMSAVSAAA